MASSPSAADSAESVFSVVVELPRNKCWNFALCSSTLPSCMALHHTRMYSLAASLLVDALDLLYHQFTRSSARSCLSSAGVTSFALKFIVSPCACPARKIASHLLYVKFHCKTTFSTAQFGFWGVPSVSSSRQLTPWQASSSAAYESSQLIQSERKWGTAFLLFPRGVYTTIVVSWRLAAPIHAGLVGTVNSCKQDRSTLRFL